MRADDRQHADGSQLRLFATINHFDADPCLLKNLINKKLAVCGPAQCCRADCPQTLSLILFKNDRKFFQCGNSSRHGCCGQSNSRRKTTTQAGDAAFIKIRLQAPGVTGTNEHSDRIAADIDSSLHH